MQNVKCKIMDEFMNQKEKESFRIHHLKFIIF